jgi:poly(A) polymerase
MMLQVVADILRRRRAEGWLVGGTVRDRELGRDSPDLDLVVADDPAAVAREIAGQLGSPWFALSTRHNAYRVMGPEGHVDVARTRGAGIADDLSQRDFTMNAMAIPVGTDDLVDPFGGLRHLWEERLVAVSERIFEDDPLRLMRAARFSHLLGLRLDPPLEALLRSQTRALVRAAPERVAAEMALTLSAGDSATAVRLWHDLGLLAVLLPELDAGRAVPDEAVEARTDGAAPQEAATSASLAQTFVLLERLDDILAGLAVWFPGSAGAVAERLARPVDGSLIRPVALRLAAILCGLRPQTAAAAGRRLKLSSAAVSLLRTASGRFREGRCSSEALRKAADSRRAAVLFLWDAAPWELEVILLAAAAAAPPTRGAAPQAEALAPLRHLMTLWSDRLLHGTPVAPVDGEVLMRELDLAPGPRLGAVLREVRLGWEAGEVKTAAEALSLAEGVVARM